MSDKKTLKYKALITAVTLAIAAMLVLPMPGGPPFVYYGMLAGGVWGMFMSVLWFEETNDLIHRAIDRLLG